MDEDTASSNDDLAMDEAMIEDDDTSQELDKPSEQIKPSQPMSSSSPPSPPESDPMPRSPGSKLQPWTPSTSGSNRLETMTRQGKKPMSFKEIKRRALYQSVLQSGIYEQDFTKATKDNIVDREDLGTFAEVAYGLVHLSAMPNTSIKILTNSDEESVKRTIDQELSLKHLEKTLKLKDKIISSSTVGKFKPAKEMYRALLSDVGRGVGNHQVWLISSNPVDLVGAQDMGMSTVWLNRWGAPWPDYLFADWQGNVRMPTIVVRGLTMVEDELKKWGVGNPTLV
ncbi:hypothetical protein EG328_007108 [Venturia inaequalis]|uniref:Uncharacterized protein n=1 Tax=Venturia inaequalis TaxID=5025 RepID=A0A8H3UGE3_VENIN|nr:hypothetical protein EG328_007108 [Venturia inaequalis]